MNKLYSTIPFLLRFLPRFRMGCLPQFQHEFFLEDPFLQATDCPREYPLTGSQFLLENLFLHSLWATVPARTLLLQGISMVCSFPQGRAFCFRDIPHRLHMALCYTMGCRGICSGAWSKSSSLLLHSSLTCAPTGLFLTYFFTPLTHSCSTALLLFLNCVYTEAPPLSLWGEHCPAGFGAA